MPNASYTVHNPEAPRLAVDAQIESIARQLLAATVAATPRDTGRLAAGWRIEKIRPAKFRVYNDVPYGRYVEYGTRRKAPVAFFGRAIFTYRSRYSR